jgi:biopolymer transport protein ExbB/TolQ
LALVTLGFLAFLLVTLFWMAWAVMWLVAALFWLAWPLTLLILAAIAWRAQARYWRQEPSARAPSEHAPVGNRAFDEYRDETLQHLDEERHKFGEFLARLRSSKDKAAFDRFMAERRSRPSDGAHGAIA